MTVGSIVNAAQQGQQATRQSNISINELNADFDFFLRLFTTQLQNQNPTDPTDTEELTNQLTQFSQVEQQVRTNEQLERLLDAQNQSQLSTAVSFIGSEVETDGNTSELIGGRAVFSYNLAAPADDVLVIISDSDGRPVFRGDGTQNVGNNLVTWNGINSFTGEFEPEGDYTVSVQAKDADGEDVDVDAHSVGIVSSVETDNGAVVLRIGERRVPLTDVLAVRTPTLGLPPEQPPAQEQGGEEGTEGAENGEGTEPDGSEQASNGGDDSGDEPEESQG